MRRKIVPGKVHYLVIDNSRGKQFFRRKSDYREGVDALLQLAYEYDVQIYAWHLFPSCIHMLVSSNQAAYDIGRFMKALAFRVTVERYGRSFLPWGVKYHSSPVEGGAWVLACMRYIEAGAESASAVPERVPSEVSSYALRCDAVRRQTLAWPQSFLDLGDTPEKRLQRYREAVRHGCDDREAQVISAAIQRSAPVGSDYFVNSVRAR